MHSTRTPGKLGSSVRQPTRKESHLWRCWRSAFQLIPQAVRFLSSLSNWCPCCAGQLQSNTAHHAYIYRNFTVSSSSADLGGRHLHWTCVLRAGMHLVADTVRSTARSGVSAEQTPVLRGLVSFLRFRSNRISRRPGPYPCLQSACHALTHVSQVSAGAKNSLIQVPGVSYENVRSTYVAWKFALDRENAGSGLLHQWYTDWARPRQHLRGPISGVLPGSTCSLLSAWQYGQRGPVERRVC